MSEKIYKKIAQAFMGNVVSQKLNSIVDQAKNKIQNDTELSAEEKIQLGKAVICLMQEESDAFYIKANLRLDGIEVGGVSVTPKPLTNDGIY